MKLAGVDDYMGETESAEKLEEDRSSQHLPSLH